MGKEGGMGEGGWEGEGGENGSRFSLGDQNNVVSLKKSDETCRGGGSA